LDVATGASIKFTAEVDAYDASGNLLASFTEKGVATTAEDNSAIFVGISSSSANISQIALSIRSCSSGEKGDFAINKFDFRTSAAPTAPVVSQPASAFDLNLLASTLLGTTSQPGASAPVPGPAAPSAPASGQSRTVASHDTTSAVPAGTADIVFAGSGGAVTDDHAWLFASLSGQLLDGI